jgi:hypothetical protein
MHLCLYAAAGNSLCALSRGAATKNDNIGMRKGMVSDSVDGQSGEGYGKKGPVIAGIV